MKACDLKKGAVVSIAGTTYVAKDVQVKSPSSRSGNTLVQGIVSRRRYETEIRTDLQG